MLTGVKNFIEQKIDLIDTNDFATLYRQTRLFFDEEDRGEAVPELTQILLNAGINPLLYMKFIPSHYLAGRDITEFNVPDNIVTISEFAFSHCFELRELTLPKAPITIEGGAFLNCSLLSSITFNSKIPHINSGAFRWCNLIKDIYYPGTIREYEMISSSPTKGKEFNEVLNVNATIHCTNGDILGKDFIKI